MRRPHWHRSRRASFKARHWVDPGVQGGCGVVAAIVAPFPCERVICQRLILNLGWAGGGTIARYGCLEEGLWRGCAAINVRKSDSQLTSCPLLQSGACLRGTSQASLRLGFLGVPFGQRMRPRWWFCKSPINGNRQQHWDQSELKWKIFRSAVYSCARQLTLPRGMATPLSWRMPHVVLLRWLDGRPKPHGGSMRMARRVNSMQHIGIRKTSMIRGRLASSTRHIGTRRLLHRVPWRRPTNSDR